MNHYLGEKPGDIIEFETKEKVGDHKGFWYYTIGQRKDIGLSGGPWYVVDKDPKKNQVFISKKYHEKDKERDTLEVSDFNWFEGKFPNIKKLKVKLRHGPDFNNCALTKLTSKKARVKLTKRDQGIAPGQFAVFYDKDKCLGSAIIN